MRQKITASLVAKLNCPSEKAQAWVRDSEVSGFAVRITNKGVKSFVFERRPKGVAKVKQITIGRCGEWSVEQARDTARKLAVEFADPDYLQKRSEAKARKSFSDVFSQYAETKLLTLAETTRNKHRGFFDREILPLVGNLPLEKFTRRHLSGIILPMQQKGHQGTASGVWKAVSAFLTWCVKVGLLEVNPVLGATPEFAINKRQRFLSLYEIKRVWLAANTVNPVRCSAIRLLLLLPFRKTEFTLSRWDEYDGNYLHIPVERTKNNSPISLPFSDFVKSCLPARRNDTDLMFSTNGKVATRLDDKLLKGIIEEADVEPFGWHDFRRTFSTHLNEKPNADFTAIEACLNHTVTAQRGVAGIYNRAEYRSQKQAVLQQWSDIVEAAVSGR
ncbi:MAG: integrase arm-type DNA-binding domain-containing protein [Proteobacteria bacterium]|nr:integrase arm-type DNA-binding domain-containing protein [Pseudomonadota bacterium]